MFRCFWSSIIVMALGLKRKRNAESTDFHHARKRINTSNGSDAPAPLATRPSEPATDFPMFCFLPKELQLRIFEQALEDLADKPRIALLDATATPCFDNTTPERGVTMGWDLTLENSDEMHRENPYDRARRFLQVCPIGAYVAKRFLNSHVVWDPPHYCNALRNLDLSLESDIYWLPDNLYPFVSAREGPAASPQHTRDESWIRRLMVNLDTLEDVVRWSQGRVEEHELSEGNLLAPLSYRHILETICWTYFGCTEIIVMVGTERRHFSWDKVRYIPPAEGDDYFGPEPQWEVDQASESRCRALWDEYLSLNETQFVWPGMSFAFAT